MLRRNHVSLRLLTRLRKKTNVTETSPTGVDELQDCKEVDLGGSQDTDDFAACDDWYDGDGDDVMSNDDGGSSML